MRLKVEKCQSYLLFWVTRLLAEWKSLETKQKDSGLEKELVLLGYILHADLVSSAKVEEKTFATILKQQAVMQMEVMLNI